MTNGYDLTAYNLLSTTQKENVISYLFDKEFTQVDIDYAIENIDTLFNPTSDKQYNSLYVQDGALLLSDFFNKRI